MMSPPGRRTAATSSVSSRESILDLVLYAGPVAKFVLIFLLGLSVVSWAVIFFKYRSFRRSRRESRKFRDIFWTVRKLEQIKEGSRDLTQGYLVKIFDAGYEELKNIREENPGSLIDKERRLMSISRALSSAQIREAERQEAFLSFLATTGNSAPFIGLFGTVWGIMDSFRNIGLAGSASLAVVAPGISEALIATAAGLFTAIPAVMAYNYFTNKVRVMAGDMEAFSSEFLSIIETLFLSK